MEQVVQKTILSFGKYSFCYSIYLIICPPHPHFVCVGVSACFSSLPLLPCLAVVLFIDAVVLWCIVLMLCFVLAMCIMYCIMFIKLIKQFKKKERKKDRFFNYLAVIPPAHPLTQSSTDSIVQWLCWFSYPSNHLLTLTNRFHNLLI